MDLWSPTGDAGSTVGLDRYIGSGSISNRRYRGLVSVQVNWLVSFMVIRKISVGADYKNAMNYLHGQDVLRGEYTIDLIIMRDTGFIEIWIKNNSGVLLWKSFNSNMPVSIEYDIDF